MKNKIIANTIIVNSDYSKWLENQSNTILHQVGEELKNQLPSIEDFEKELNN